MENKNKKTISKNLLIIAVLAIILFPMVSAFGFSSPYSSSNPLVVYPGETKSFDIRLKTSSLEGDLSLKAELVDAAGVASLTGSNSIYSVSPGIDGVVGVKITMPENTPIGQNYPLVFKFSDITPSKEEGTVTLATSSMFSLGVLVAEKPIEPPPVQEVPPIPSEEPTPEGGAWGWLVAIAILIIIIAIIIYLVFRRKKQ